MIKKLNYFLTNYFVSKWLDRIIKSYFRYYLSIVKPKYIKKITYSFWNSIAKGRSNNAAFFQWNKIDPKQKPLIVFQIPILRSIVLNHIRLFLYDTITEVLRHEFAHLKYQDEKKTE